MRNDFDRFHSDIMFSTEVADNYLSTYVENSINGFADLVIVPNEQGVATDSFLTANYLKEKWDSIGHPISKMVLSAVSSKTNKGWYLKLISEMTYLLKENGAETIYMNTQSTNIPVLYTWEKLGYHIGRTTHLLSMYIS
jgi:dTDP-4-amino-4,6-dideoxy-D-galactose acyltransferase